MHSKKNGAILKVKRKFSVKNLKHLFLLTDDELLLCPLCQKKMIYLKGHDCSSTAMALFECECKKCSYREYRGGFASELFYESIEEKRKFFNKIKMINFLNRNRYFCLQK